MLTTLIPVLIIAFLFIFFLSQAQGGGGGGRMMNFGKSKAKMYDRPPPPPPCAWLRKNINKKAIINTGISVVNILTKTIYILP
jgi:hypothetical protein